MFSKHADTFQDYSSSDLADFDALLTMSKDEAALLPLDSWLNSISDELDNFGLPSLEKEMDMPKSNLDLTTGEENHNQKSEFEDFPQFLSSEESDFHTFEGEPEDSEQEEEKVPQGPIKNESSFPGLPKKGRPKKDMTKSPQELVAILKQRIAGELNKIEAKNEVISRRRDDVKRASLIRVVKKIPDFILKAVVSKGDYKHEDVDRLLSSYKVAYGGFTSVLNLFESTADTPITSSDAACLTSFREFCVIHFPTKKINKLASRLLDSEGDITTSMKKAKLASSVKQLTEACSDNMVLRTLLLLARELTQDMSEFSKCQEILNDLIVKVL